MNLAGVKPMDPYVRREVLSHLRYKRLDFGYVHPSWNNAGEAVTGLDLCFLPINNYRNELPTELIVMEEFGQSVFAYLPGQTDGLRLGTVAIRRSQCQPSGCHGRSNNSNY